MHAMKFVVIAGLIYEKICSIYAKEKLDGILIRSDYIIRPSKYEKTVLIYVHKN